MFSISRLSINGSTVINNLFLERVLLPDVNDVIHLLFIRERQYRPVCETVMSWKYFKHFQQNKISIQLRIFVLLGIVPGITCRRGICFFFIFQVLKYRDCKSVM